MYPDVVAVSPSPGHRLHLAFANGECRCFDLTPYLRYPVFQPLRDPERFAAVRIAYGTAVWPGGIDLAPERLYAEGLPVAFPCAAGG